MITNRSQKQIMQLIRINQHLPSLTVSLCNFYQIKNIMGLVPDIKLRSKVRQPVKEYKHVMKKIGRPGSFIDAEAQSFNQLVANSTVIVDRSDFIRKVIE